jgi:hypothetical protein
VAAFVVLSLVAAALAAVTWWRVRRRLDRQRALMNLCLDAGLDFAPVDPFPDTTWVAHPRFAHPDRGAENVVWDRESGEGVRVFDFWYETSTDESARPARRYATCAAVRVPFSCPRLRIAPRGIHDVAAPFGDEIALELEEFDRRFRVRCADRRFAFAFLDQRMMQALLALPPEVLVDANEDTVVLWAPLLPPARVLLLFEAARAVRRHLPRVVSDLYPARPQRGPHEERWFRGSSSAEPTGDPA